MIKIHHRLVANDLLQFLNTEKNKFGYYVREGKGVVWLKESDEAMLFYDYEDPETANEDIKELNRIKLKL